MQPKNPFNRQNAPQGQGDNGGQLNKVLRSVLLYFGIAILLGSIVMTFFAEPAGDHEIDFSAVIQDVRNGDIEQITVNGDGLEILYRDGTEATSRKETQASLATLLYEAGIENAEEQVRIIIEDPNPYGLWLGILVNFLPLLLIGGFIIFFMRQAQRSSGSVFGFGKSNAKLFRRDMPKVTFKDAAGVDEAIQELEEVVDFLRNPKKYQSVGARIPRGVLLVGPAGVGKTLLARAVAGEAEVPFYSIAGSEFMEMFVGVGASRVRDLFETAKNTAPAIIFIDEIESIGRHRGAGVSSSHGEQEQTLNQILVEMDGFTQNTGVIVLSATNRPDLLDPALTRPGRFDRRVMIDYPDIEGRKQILEIHRKGKPLAENVSIERLAQRTVGFSGADLENMLNEAAILTARENRSTIEASDLEEAATKVKMGPTKRRLQSEEDKKMTAYHEAGHAIVAHYLPHTDPVHRVSIVSRGMALGYTMIPPQTDRYNQTETRLRETICSMLGGRAAESIFFNEMTIGAGNDIERATQIAHDMVVKYGMSKLGPRALQMSEQIDERNWNLDRPISHSDGTLKEIDAEIERIINEQFERAKAILEEHRDKVVHVSEALIERETIELDEFEALMGDHHPHEKTTTD